MELRVPIGLKNTPKGAETTPLKGGQVKVDTLQNARSETLNEIQRPPEPLSAIHDASSREKQVENQVTDPAPYGRKKDGTPRKTLGRPEKPRYELAPVPAQYVLHSGPDGSKPNRHVKEYAKPFTEEAVNMMVATMRNTEAPPHVRLQAAFGIVDRAWGKPKETLEIDAPADGIRGALAGMSTEDLVAAIRLLRAPVIDVTPTSVDAKKPGP